ncbi:GNAT family N-acetyltransferase [Ktedonobacter racemifer]|uniref:GCN5-related N-acetyltransferase n=1 Tax=Ktedonobacter racemifer DSM 44963 TaxID=485913 RepID=D6U2E8_KTERA|nr:GNAT family protein [Ktedonobacter racemifer]EFH82816.1 GCN5-related N-acetyltransferase [Ktedonobacter racemifer DSM 44963]
MPFTMLETERLRLRRFTESDLSLFMAYRNDPEIARYQGWEGISEAEAWAFIIEQRVARSGTPGEGFQIAIELKETETLIGDCFFKVNTHDKRQAEIGYTLARAYHGKGYATEAVTCWLNYAFQAFHLHRVIAIADCENHSSYALMDRLGMRREGHFIQNAWFKGHWCDEYLYAILRNEWLRAHPVEDASR